jgi:chloramphenicol O-acetyltransferase
LKNRIHTGNYDNKKVPQQSNGVDGQEQNEEENLHSRVVCKSKKNKFSNSCVVFTNHILDMFFFKNQGVSIKRLSINTDIISKIKSTKPLCSLSSYPSFSINHISFTIRNN